jgi:hypothetical protein
VEGGRTQRERKGSAAVAKGFGRARQTPGVKAENEEPLEAADWRLLKAKTLFTGL